MNVKTRLTMISPAIVGFGARAENGPNVELTGLTPTMAEQGITGKHPEGEG